MSVSPEAMHEALREPWHSLHRQREGVSFGVWVFLGSEVMFFGGALMLYAMYRVLYPDAFAAAARETNIWYGTINTAVLLTSSLTMAVASESAQAGLRRLALRCLLATAALGTAFLVIKGFEYAEDIREHLIPGPHFKLQEPAAQIFWAFYWLLTGVHALHLTIGIVMVLVFCWQGWRRTRPMPSPAYEGVALYWHLVDMVWIFLYPLIYLPGRTS
jgi:cytochrome c oxidase subunit 3